MNMFRIVPLAVVLAFGLACLSDKEVDLSPAEDELRAGDLPGASSAYDKLASENPDSVQVAVGQAYMQMLAGEYGAADKTLAAAAEKASEEIKPEIVLRRALVALRAGELDDVKKYGRESGLPAGQVLAAEVHLFDAEQDDAIALLKDAREAPGAVGETASQYLDMLESGDVIRAGLAEASAIWAVGQRADACEVAEEIVKALPDDDDKGEILLLWAGRAVTSGRPGIATSLLDELELVGTPEGQEWRAQATRAMVEISEGEYADGLARFETLKAAIVVGFAPYEGVVDARATAAALTTDKATAKALTADLEGVPVSRGLYESGAGAAAREAAPPGTAWATFLENK